ncbi:MAG: 4Fe-4S binding protein [Planctomycetota bacterium]
MKANNKIADSSEQAQVEIIKVPNGEIRILRDRCKGCGCCVQFCPNNVLEMSKEYNRKGYHFPVVKNPQACTGCKACYKSCPAGHKVYLGPNSPECIRCLKCQEKCPADSIENEYF